MVARFAHHGGGAIDFEPINTQADSAVPHPKWGDELELAYRGRGEFVDRSVAVISGSRGEILIGEVFIGVLGEGGCERFDLIGIAVQAGRHIMPAKAIEHRFAMLEPGVEIKAIDATP